MTHDLFVGRDGFGLVAVRRVMDVVGGDTWLHSDETTTTFHVRIPAEPYSGDGSETAETGH